MAARRELAGGAQLIVLLAIAAILAVGIVVLDRYNAGSKDELTVETRGMQMISALTKYRQETGGYPDNIEKLVPKFSTIVSTCPNGAPMEYRLTGGEYVLTCRNVVFKLQPHSYDSRTRSWDG